MGSQQPFTRINAPLEQLRKQISAAAPLLTRPELLDLADQIHAIIRTRHGEGLSDAPSRPDASFLDWISS